MSTVPTRRRPSRTRPGGKGQRVPGFSNRRRRCVEPVNASCSLGRSRLQTRCETTRVERCYDRTHQYSITALTDGAAQVVERYAYSAYGEPTILDASLTELPDSAVGNRYMYTGREWDGKLGLYHYRARMYSAENGRFVSRDPIGYADSLGLYQYVSSMPLDNTDPTGNYMGGHGGINPTAPSSQKNCVQFFVGYSPTQPSGNPSEDACAKVSGAKHVSICTTDCKKPGVSTAHHGRGGTTRCGMPGSKYCELTPSTTGSLGDGSGKSCANATPAEIAACVANVPDKPGPFNGLTNNCHQDIRNRASKCCLSYANCITKMPSCFF